MSYVRVLKSIGLEREKERERREKKEEKKESRKLAFLKVSPIYF